MMVGMVAYLRNGKSEAIARNSDPDGPDMIANFPETRGTEK
jgi:hypothetical protein